MTDKEFIEYNIICMWLVAVETCSGSGGRADGSQSGTDGGFCRGSE